MKNRPPAHHDAILPAKPPCDEEERLFRDAMASVTALPGHCRRPHPCVAGEVEAGAAPSFAPAGDEEAALFLQEIARLGHGVPSARRGSGAEEAVHPLSGNRLRQVKRGDIAVRRQLDLHGLTRDEALHALPAFLEHAARTGEKAVLVITGKGHHSAGEPVLGQAVASWLRGDGRGLVLEFVTAPRDMGGSGALVVFIRPPPG
jgi:DNA-nicking Smr family endonuclease